MSALESTLEALREYIEEHGEDSEFDPPGFEAHEKDWNALEERLGKALPDDAPQRKDCV